MPTICWTLLGAGGEGVNRAEQALDLIVTQSYGNFTEYSMLLFSKKLCPRVPSEIEQTFQHSN